MFGIGFSEILVISIIALIFVGPKKLPDLAKQAGRMFVQFKRMTSDVRSTFDDFIRKAEEEIRQEEREKLLKVLGVHDTTSQPSPATEDQGHNNPPHPHDPNPAEAPNQPDTQKT